MVVVKLFLTRLLLSLGILCSLFLDQAYAKQVDLRYLQSPVKNQENRDTCAYFATAALLESAIKNLTGQDYDVSEEYEIFRLKILNAWRPEVEFGNTYDLLFGFANHNSFYLEAQLPYQDSSPDFTKPLSQAQWDFYDLRKQKVPVVHYRGLKAKLLNKMWLNRPWSTLFMQELDQKRPIVVTLKVSLNHINDQKGTFTYNEDIDADCSAGKLSCGGHAVLITGYDDEQKVFIFKNSWGPEWGHEGYGFVTFDHIDNFIDQPLTAYFDKLVSPWVKVREP